MKYLGSIIALPVFLVVQSAWLPFASTIIVMAILYAISREIYESFRDHRPSRIIKNIYRDVTDISTWYVIGGSLFLPVLMWVQLVFPESHVLD